MDDSYEGLKDHFDSTTQAWLQEPRAGKYLEWVWDFPGEEGGQVPKGEGGGQVLGFCPLGHRLVFSAPYSSPPRGCCFPAPFLLTPHCSDRTKSPLCPQWHIWAVAEMLGRLACGRARWPSETHRIPLLLSQATAGPCIPSAGQEAEAVSIERGSVWYPGKTQDHPSHPR